MIHILQNIFAFIFIIGVAVFVHEGGHFLVAKFFRMRVYIFSLGFGKRLCGFKKGTTDYRISLIPLGGYVSFSEEGTDPYKSDFEKKPRWQKILVLFAGPFMNLVLAGILVTIAAPEAYLRVVLTKPTINTVLPNSPAESAMLSPGDTILEADGVPIATWIELQNIVALSPEKPVSLLVERGGKKISVTVVPATMTIENEVIGVIGITPIESTAKEISFGDRLKQGPRVTAKLTGRVLVALKNIVTGKISAQESVSGPVGIAKISGEASRQGFGSLLLFTAFLSINLAVFNLLPIPILDGGQILVFTAESVMRKTLSLAARERIQKIGIVFLLLVMAFALGNDLLRVFKN